MEKKTKKQRWPVAVWMLVGLMAVVNYALLAARRELFPDTAAFFTQILWVSAGLVFAFVGALIISRDRKHVIGWLLMITPIAITISTILGYFIEPELAVATELNTRLFLYLWFGAWSWWLLIGPILLIFYLFPTGHLISKRWRWGVALIGMAFSLFLFLATFSAQAEDAEGTRIFANPIGFLSNATVESLVGVMGIFLVSGTIVSLLSVFIRYRNSQALERAQMRWLFIACALFVINYSISFISTTYNETAFGGLAFIVTVLAIPISIGIAVLRYRLWDVDVVINRSLVYAVLTTLLAGIFAATAALLAQVAKAAFGEEMQQAAAAVAAIFVASIFQPLRTWVENSINRRLFPENIDLSQGLIEINPDFWDWVGLPKIMNASLDHVEDIYSCSAAAIYLKKSENEFLPVAALGIPLNKLEPCKLNKEEQESLQRKKGILHERVDPFAISIPIHLPRRKGAEILGILRLGRRKQGRGYSGDDLKTLVSFGAKLGQPVYAFSAAKKT